jgi:hypothetical protein
MDLNLLTIFALQHLNRSLNHADRRAVPEVALPEIDYALLALETRPRTKRTERDGYAEQAGTVTPAGVCCM